MQFDHSSGQSLAIDGAKIYVELQGESSREALLFLHGGLGTIEDFNELLPDLAQKYRLIGIDSRGQGASSLGPGRLSYERLEQDVVQVVRQLELHSVSIIGFSDGGITAYRLASSKVLPIRKLVTIGASWHPRELEPLRATFRNITGESWRKKFPETYQAYQRLNPEPDFDGLIRAVIEMWLDEEPSGYPGERVKNMTCPLLIVRGDDDHLTSRQAAVDLANLVSGSHLANIAFAGHVAHQDQKQPFLAAVKQFLT